MLLWQSRAAARKERMPASVSAFLTSNSAENVGEDGDGGGERNMRCFVSNNRTSSCASRA